jgi:hypothetical protein
VYGKERKKKKKKKSYERRKIKRERWVSNEDMRGMDQVKEKKNNKV